MVSKALLQLLLVAIVAARFGGSSSRVTRASAVLAAESPQNNRYTSYYSNNVNRNNNNNNKDNKNIDGVADSRRTTNNAADNNDNYNYNKASPKWQLPQQKLYANPQGAHSQWQQQHEQQQQPQQQQQQQGQFADDPEAARNDFLLQLPDLNADAVQGVPGLFVAQDSYNNNNNNKQEQRQGNNNMNNNEQDYDNVEEDTDSDNNVWQVAAELERERDGEYAPQLKRSSRREEAQTQTQTEAEDSSSSIDYEGEEDFAVARAGGQERQDADELSDQLPYGIQNVRKRRVRSVMPPALQSSNSAASSSSSSDSEGVTYQSLCPTKRVTVKLDNGEYRPNHYVEVTCANNYAPLPPRVLSYDNYNYRNNELPLLRALLNERAGEKREICSATGFSCIQLNRTIHLIRLNEGSGCWESETRTVPSGCECMWPKHSYGDIASYHQAQKRFSNALNNLRSRNIDYTPGTGYRQLTLRTRAPKAGNTAAGRSRREQLELDLDYDNY